MSLRRFHAILLALIASAFSALAADALPSGFTTLFNGRDLKGWRGGETFDHRDLLAMDPIFRARQIEKWSVELTLHWRVENGELVSNGTGRFLSTEKDYGDFELLAEYRIEPGGDSGLYLRGVPQVQLWDPANPLLVRHGANKGSGGLWNNPPGSPGREPLVRADKPAGEWNQLRVRMVGSRVSVWLNGQVVVDHAVLENFFDRKKPVLAKGPIQLQTHGGEMRWRHFFVREIGSEEAREILAAQHRDAGFASIWNGQDFTGWTGAVDDYEIVEGAIRGKIGRAGVMYRNEELGDFVARCEFRTAPGGSAGLALRYPGTGDPATAGMCRLQMLDEQYDKKRGPIDARQAHGSAYGLAAALRGYQRPRGEWNFQEVTVRGSTVRVELNGFIVLDADLGEVRPAAYFTQYEYGRRDRSRGFFGLVSEGAGLAFRDLAIKNLPALR